MTNQSLSPGMIKALAGVQVDDDGKLHVGWPNTFVKSSTRDALCRRGLINDQDQLTELGEAWFNENMDG